MPVILNNEKRYKDMKTAKTFNDLYSDVTIAYYRISTAVIGYARFVRNCQNEAKLLTKSGEILVDFCKNNLLNESFFKHRTFLGECMFSADTSLLMKNIAQYLTKNNEIQKQENIVKDMEEMLIDAKEKLARMKHILKESKS